MSDAQDPNETVSDSATETIQTDRKPKRKCTPAQLECLRRNREKALEVIRQKGEKARLAKELKDRYKEHVDTERDAEIQRLRAALAETPHPSGVPDGTGSGRAPPKGAKPALKAVTKKRKRAPSPSESESEESPSPPPKRKAKKRKPPTPSDTSSSEEEDPAEARLQALHRQMFPFG